MAGIIDHESMLTDTGMVTVTDSNTTNIFRNIMAGSYLTTSTTSSNSISATMNTQRTLSYPLAQSSTSFNPHSHTDMSMHTGMSQRLPDSTAAMLKDSSTDSLRFDYTMDEENQFSSTKQRPKKTTPAVYREQERFVPINNTGRVMRNAVPRNAKISKDAKQCMQECISEFISFLTSEASDRCIDEKRKTITGDDILYALSTLGFDGYVQPMQQYLKKYREFLHFDKPGSKESENYQLEEEDAILRASLQEDQTQVNAHTLQLLTGQLPTTSQSSLPRL